MSTWLSIKKVNREKLAILEQLCTQFPAMYPAESDFENLLHAHIEELVVRLRVLKAKGQFMVNINMSRTEALAFMYYWRGLGVVGLPPYETELIRQISSQIDKTEGGTL